MGELGFNIKIGNLSQIKKQLSGAVNVAGGGKGGGAQPAKEQKKQTNGIIKQSIIMGGVFSLIGKLLDSSQVVTDLMSVMGGLINQLVAPFVPFLIGILKPTTVLLNTLIGLMFKFFRDPVGVITKGLQAITGVVAKLLGIDPAKFNDFIKSITAVAQGFVTVFENAFDVIKKFFSGDFKGAFQALLPLLKSVWDLLIKIFIAAWELLKVQLLVSWAALIAVFKFAWKALKFALKLVWLGLITVFRLAWEGLKIVLTASWQAISTIGKFIFDGLVAIFTRSFEVLKNIGGFIRDKVLGFFGRGGGGGRETNVNDAIITKDGRVIRTNPADTLIATKNPGALLGGGISIIIQGSADQRTINEMMIRLKTELSRRGAL